MIMGVGMALTMSPMSTAAMNAVDADKAGVASGILSMSRMVGGTFGVAAIGALFQHLARARLEDTLLGAAGHAPPSASSSSTTSARAAAAIVDGLDPALAAQVGTAAQDAFIHALSSGMWLSAGVAVAGAIVAFWLAGAEAGRAPARGGRREAGDARSRRRSPARRQPAARSRRNLPRPESSRRTESERPMAS